MPTCRAAISGAHRPWHRASSWAGDGARWMASNANTCASSMQTKRSFTSRCYQADRLTRYVGPDNRTPTLSRLGSPEWRSVKSPCQGSRPRCSRGSARAVCQTQRGRGLCFPARLRLAAGAGSQLPVHRDRRPDARAGGSEARYAERPGPMDRLICGDVGYGKTEVALRAAFKAVMDGKQVADPGADHRAGAAALQYLHATPVGLPGGGRDALPLPHRRNSSARSSPSVGRREDRYHHRHAPPALVGCPVQGPGTADHRRRTALRRHPQRDTSRRCAPKWMC